MSDADNQFEFKLPNGQTVRTGNIKPETLSLSFAEYPEQDLYELDQIVRILTAPGRIRSRDRFGDDWIKNQGNRSSCNPYAAAGALERAREFAGFEYQKLQPEFIYPFINGGRDQGSLLHDGMRIITEKGCCPEGMVPYQAYRESDVGIEAKRVAKNFRAHECYQLPTSSLEKFWRAALTAVCRQEPLVLAVHVGNRFMEAQETAGVDRGPGNHAVGADDAVLPSSKPGSVMDIMLDMFNSWDLPFGDRGRTLLNPDHVAEPMEWHAMYAIRSATADPNTFCPTL